MCGIKKIDTRKETEELYKKLQGEDSKLPLFLYDRQNYISFAAAYIKDERPAGLAFGVWKENDETFYMHYLRMSASASKRQDIRQFSEEFLNLVKQELGLKKIVIFLEQEDYAVPSYAELLKEIEGLSIEKTTYLRQVGVNTRDFGHFRKYHWYCPEIFGEKGYEAIRADDFPGQWREELKRREQSGQLPSDYLSPGLWEEKWRYDPDTSFVLVKKGADMPSGWIVTERMRDDAVRIRRFYTNKQERRFWLGPSFSTWVLDRLAERYRQVCFEVEKGNRQMEMFTFCYCKPILAFNYIKCNLTIKLK